MPFGWCLKDYTEYTGLNNIVCIQYYARYTYDYTFVRWTKTRPGPMVILVDFSLCVYKYNRFKYILF